MTAPLPPAPGSLVERFAAELMDLSTPKGERWSCACGEGLAVPSHTPPEMRRRLWLAFVRTHTRKGCEVRP